MWRGLSADTAGRSSSMVIRSTTRAIWRGAILQRHLFHTQSALCNKKEMEELKRLEKQLDDRKQMEARMRAASPEQTTGGEAREQFQRYKKHTSPVDPLNPKLGYKLGYGDKYDEVMKAAKGGTAQTDTDGAAAAATATTTDTGAEKESTSDNEEDEDEDEDDSDGDSDSGDTPKATFNLPRKRTPRPASSASTAADTRKRKKRDRGPAGLKIIQFRSNIEKNDLITKLRAGVTALKAGSQVRLDLTDRIPDPLNKTFKLAVAELTALGAPFQPIDVSRLSLGPVPILHLTPRKPDDKTPAAAATAAAATAPAKPAAATPTPQATTNQPSSPPTSQPAQPLSKKQQKRAALEAAARSVAAPSIGRPKAPPPPAAAAAAAAAAASDEAPEVHVMTREELRELGVPITAKEAAKALGSHGAPSRTDKQRDKKQKMINQLMDDPPTDTADTNAEDEARRRAVPSGKRSAAEDADESDAERAQAKEDAVARAHAGDLTQELLARREELKTKAAQAAKLERIQKKRRASEATAARSVSVAAAMTKSGRGGADDDTLAMAEAAALEEAAEAEDAEAELADADADADVDLDEDEELPQEVVNPKVSATARGGGGGGGGGFKNQKQKPKHNRPRRSHGGKKRNDRWGDGGGGGGGDYGDDGFAGYTGDGFGGGGRRGGGKRGGGRGGGGAAVRVPTSLEITVKTEVTSKPAPKRN